ncbi:MAG: hypothetical protein ACYC26_10390 [Phycisphaerales bacterium]
MYVVRRLSRAWPPVFPVWVLGLLALLTSPVLADIDFNLANAGASRPYSQLSDAIPTAWTLLNPAAVSGPTIGRSPADWLLSPANLAEPGLGSPNTMTLGQIVPTGIPGADRGVWGVFDRLAVISVPHLLYFDTFSTRAYHPADLLTNTGYLPILFGPGDLSGGDSGVAGGSSSGGFIFDPVIVVPEPASLALLLPAAIALIRRRSSPLAAY